MIEAYRNVYLEINKFIPRYSRLVVNSNYLAKTLLDHGATPKQVVVVPSPQFEKASHVVRAYRPRVYQLSMLDGLPKQRVSSFYWMRFVS